MTEDEMQDYLELFWNDGQDPIFSVWEESTEDKRLLCASHEEATVYKYVLASPTSNEEQKGRARAVLMMLEAEESGHASSCPAQAMTEQPFLVAEISWDSLSTQRREELCRGCGYWVGVAKRPWSVMLPTTQVLLARELERISGGYATLTHNEFMEELRQEPGWEQTCDPRLTGHDEYDGTR